MPVIFPLFFLPSCLPPFQDDTFPGAQPLLSVFSLMPETHSFLHSPNPFSLPLASAWIPPVCARTYASMYISSSRQLLLLLLGVDPLFCRSGFVWLPTFQWHPRICKCPGASLPRYTPPSPLPFSFAYHHLSQQGLCYNVYQLQNQTPSPSIHFLLSTSTLQTSSSKWMQETIYTKLCPR